MTPSSFTLPSPSPRARRRSLLMMVLIPLLISACQVPSEPEPETRTVTRTRTQAAGIGDCSALLSFQTGADGVYFIDPVNGTFTQTEPPFGGAPTMPRISNAARSPDTQIVYTVLNGILYQYTPAQGLTQIATGIPATHPSKAGFSFDGSILWIHAPGQNEGEGNLISLNALTGQVLSQAPLNGVLGGGGMQLRYDNRWTLVDRESNVFLASDDFTQMTNVGNLGLSGVWGILLVDDVLYAATTSEELWSFDADTLAPLGQIATNAFPSVQEGDLTTCDIADLDRDGVPDTDDSDDDGDGILDFVEDFVDFDDDGILNHRDLDSDNDGIPDNIEGQSTRFYRAPNGVVTLNGIDTAYSTNPLSPPSSDGDLTPDYLDINADGDSLLDSEESGLTLTGVDADRDGLDDGVDIDDLRVGPINAGLNPPATALRDSDGDALTFGGDVDYREVNRPPRITSGGGQDRVTLSQNELITAVTTLTATDLDNDVVTFSLSGPDAALFEIDPNTGALRFREAPDFENPLDVGGNNVYDFTVTASDPSGATDTQVFQVTVLNFNEPPEITSNGGGDTATIPVDEGTTAVTDVNATDPENEVLVYSLEGRDANRFNIDPSTGVVTFRVAPDAANPSDTNRDNIYALTVVATDPEGARDAQALSVEVQDLNDAPTIVSDGGGDSGQRTVVENQTLATDVDATDPDSDTIEYSLTGGADRALFAIDPDTGVVTFINAPDFEDPSDADNDGVYEIVVQVDDNRGGTDTQSISITVANGNDAPAITSDGGGDTATITSPENGTSVTDVDASDVDNDTLRYTLSGPDASRFVIDPDTGVLTWVTPPDAEVPTDQGADGTYEVTVTVTDPSGASDTQSLSISLEDINEPPIINSNGGGDAVNISVREGVTEITDVNAFDPEGSDVTFSIEGDDAGLFTINPDTGELVFNTAPDVGNPSDQDGDGVYEVTVVAADPSGLEDRQDLSVRVDNVNDAPEITSDGGGVDATLRPDENQTAVTTVTANDPDGDTLRFEISGDDAGLFAIDPDTGELTFVSAPDAENPADQDNDGTYNVTVRAVDPDGLEDTQDLEIIVGDINEAPEITSNGGDDVVTLNVGEGDTAVSDVDADDPDGDTLVYSLTGPDAALFAVDPDTGVLTLRTPLAEDNPEDENGDGTYEVTVMATDPSGATDAQSFEVTIVRDNTDTDGDGIRDVEEDDIGTDPNDADSDDDGVRDGDEPDYAIDSDDDGLINALDPDSDDDGIFDGTELGLDTPDDDTNVDAGNFVPDADAGDTTTNPLDADTDDGSVDDGVEDANQNGAVDDGERDPNDPNDDLDTGEDTDGDGITDDDENEKGTDPNDADSDDDGISDGDEPDWDQDTDGDGLINALDPDSDNDGILDGTESGVTNDTVDPDTDVDAGHFVPDADPTTTTNPLDADTDGGGVDDGAEDPNHNGRIDTDELDPNDPNDDTAPEDMDGDGLTDDEEEAAGTDPEDSDSDDDGISDGDEDNWSDDTDGDGLINALDPDSDGDGVLDGTERGVTAGSTPDGTDTSSPNFVPDADPTTTTSMVNPDTDFGGTNDGVEDTNRDGAIDDGEIDPNDPSDDADVPVDTDGDGLPDDVETARGTDPNDADSDDDGVSDGDEPAWDEDSDNDGLINALDPDSDNDGILDGTESGVTNDTVDPDTDVDAGHFVPDADPTTTTNPLDADTDGGGVDDGAEDPNHNGRIDATELDPVNADDDSAPEDTDGDGLTDDEEEAAGTDPEDADSDDDGVLDGDEPNWSDDTDGDGLINALDPDSDGDRLYDGTELGVTENNRSVDTDTRRGFFIADTDPSSKTSALLPDTDRGGIPDGAEDLNLDGTFDGDNSEGDPLVSEDDAEFVGRPCTEGLGECAAQGVWTEADDGTYFCDAQPEAPAPEDTEAFICDGRDNDCDGFIDEGLDCDGDNVDTYEDNCPGIANPGQEDTDGDGVGDACEDEDEDGIPAAEDNCPGIANPGQEDSDNDGVGDACDAPDDDDDGIPNDDDNCPGIANPNQEDADGNGVGDVCEGADGDGDGIVDSDDNCPTVSNPDQVDTDGDGVGDACTPSEDESFIVAGSGIACSTAPQQDIPLPAPLVALVMVLGACIVVRRRG